jgi:hypothetical protein
MPFEIGTFAQVFVKVYSSVVYQNIEPFDFLDGSLNVRCVGHVQSHGRNASIGMGKGLARSRIHPLRTSPQSFLNQCPSDASVCAGNQNYFAFDLHIVLRSVGFFRTAAITDEGHARIRPA